MKKIIPIMIVIVCVISVGLIFLLKDNDDSKSDEKVEFKTEIGKEFFEYTKDVLVNKTEYSFNLANIIGDVKVYFIKSKMNDTIMVREYINKETTGYYKHYDLITRINKKNAKMDHVYEIENEKDETTKLRCMYDIEKDSYDWYVVFNTMSETTTYIPVDAYIEHFRNDDKRLEKDNIKYEDTNIDIKDDQMKNNEFGYSKFDAKYIDVTDNIDKKEITFLREDKIKEIKKKFVELEENYGTTNYEKDNKKYVDKKLTNLNTKKEEQNKKEQEEEQKRKEEEAKGLKIGNFTLKYGTYNGKKNEPSEGMSITINADKTFKFVEYNRTVVTGTFKIAKENFSQDITPMYVDAIQLYKSNGEKYSSLTAWNNTTIGDNDIMSFTYSGK